MKNHGRVEKSTLGSSAISGTRALGRTDLKLDKTR